MSLVRSRRQITRAILENEFLGNLEENQVEALVSAMYSKQIPPNTLVIREGDIGKVVMVFVSFYINNSVKSFRLFCLNKTEHLISIKYYIRKVRVEILVKN